MKTIRIRAPLLALAALMPAFFTSHSHTHEQQSAAEAPNAAGAVTIDVAAYANLCGEWTYRETEDGETEIETERILGTALRGGKPVYIRQEFSGGSYPNDQFFLSADLSKGLYETGGLNDYGKPSEETFKWTPTFPLLMKTFVPGKEYVAEYRHSFFPDRAFKGKIKTEKAAVKVPYGNFDCYKVTLTAGDYIRTKWYAKHIGVVRQQNGDSVDELVSYTPAPWLVVEQPAKSALFDGVSRKSFGTRKLGAEGVIKAFTIRNLGTKELSELRIGSSGPHAGDFTVSAPQSTSVAPGRATTFKVSFVPKAKGTRSAAIRISHSTSNGNPFDIKLTGLGVK